MNPLRKQKCPGMFSVPCVGLYCMFLHSYRGKPISLLTERQQHLQGNVRCPWEWEISAVKS